MIKLKTTLEKIDRIELEASSWVTISGVNGTWVSFGADGTAAKPAAGAYAVPIWTESNRDGTVGFTPDVGITGNVTVLYGKMQGTTDKYEDGPTLGDKLYVSATGTLTPTSAGDENVVGICTKSPYSKEVLGTTFTVIDFVTI